ncbi:MAG TPA: ankyrin repeat domain-containing protein [Candidatus Babeliales bacterium]|nr:ankyrin repeat domain-containing protein [Candidatus Babeliales bacterium]
MQDKKGVTALMRVVSLGNLDLAGALINAGAEINMQNNNGMTALMLAAWGGHLNIVEVLLAAGAEINMQSNDGKTALILAAWYGHLNIIEVLLAAGADPKIQDNSGSFAVDYGWISSAIRSLLDPITPGQLTRKYTQAKYLISGLLAAGTAAHIFTSKDLVL